MVEWTEQEIKETYNKIQDKAAKDEAFRNLALNDPKKAVEEVAGKEVPDNFSIKFIENAPGVDQTFVLPDMVKEELSDDELDDVAGGKGDGNCKGKVGCFVRW